MRRLSGLRKRPRLHIRKGSFTTRDGAWRLPYKVISLQGHAKARLSPLLLLQGWTGQASDWGSFPQVLAATTSRDVIVFDQRLVGESERLRPSATVLSLDDLVQDAQGIATEAMHLLGANSVVPLGFSFGGVVAQKLCESDFGRSASDLVLCASWRELDTSLVNQQFYTVFDRWEENKLECALNFFCLGLADDIIAAKR